MTTEQEEDLRLAARFMLRFMNEAISQTRLTESVYDFAGSADGCNLWALCQNGLGEFDSDGGPSLESIRTYMREKLGER